MMLTLLILKLFQSPAFHYMPQSDTSLIKEFFPLLLLLLTQLLSTSLLLLGTIPGKVPYFITTETYYLWQVSRFPCDFKASLGPRLPFWAIIEVVSWIFCTLNMWYDSSPSWNPIYFSSWTFPYQSGLLFPVGHTLLPLLGILLDLHSNNSGRCVLLLHMNSMTWCRV